MWATYVKKRIRGLFVGDVVDRIFVFVEILPRAHTSAIETGSKARMCELQDSAGHSRSR